jgi:uncharacterized glyoxalase superfamily metalloenzyme YdcJ
MIDAIQGPPRWDGPDVLLRQTSFRALAEPRAMREPDGSVTTGALRVRFGEVEARGIALTRAGRARYDALLGEIDRVLVESPDRGSPDVRADVAQEVWEKGLPATERGLLAENLAFFTYALRDDHPDGPPPTSVRELVDEGWVTATPVVYEDFLPRSAAGIFQSNLSSEGTRDVDQQGVDYDQAWLAAAIDRPIHDPFDLYERQQNDSIHEIATALQISGVTR